MILARLDLLSPVEKRVAQRAAVIGRFFWDGAVEAVTGANGELDAVLGTLRRREFVLERISSSIAGQREFVFKHVLTATSRTRACRAASAVARTSKPRRGSSARPAAAPPT